ncbi:MAG TPA: CocE/NonD family hydrolase, partial [Gemmatimonadales bacterium]|nr:CocE/NonD family hydrolase [Gemmatimonadales bacterium]
MRSLGRAVTAAVLLGTAALACRPAAAPDTGYERRELTIPMRDGTTHFAVVLLPRSPTATLPILLVRTPFGAERELPSAEVPGPFRELAQDGYLFVVEDIRGRGRSQGTFVTARPLHDPADTAGVDESTDSYDTIDWLVKHLPGNNGKVGVLGISYRGWLAAMAGIHPHLALKAISPQAPIADLWMGDDFFHQGAFRQTQVAAYAAFVEGTTGYAMPDSDEYTFFRRFPTLDSLARATEISVIPSWEAARQHPAYDAFWQARALQRQFTHTEVPALIVGGWWDAEDLFGPQQLYRTLERTDSLGLAHLVIGPWAHGGWARPAGDSIGPVPLGARTAEYFRERIQRPWFAHWLHGTGDGKFPEAWLFETGEAAWHTLPAWPVPAATPRALYLGAGGRLSFDPPGAGDATGYDEFRSDPADPVPYAHRPDDGSGWATWMAQDQRFVTGRPDVSTWVSAPLATDLTIAGDVTATLFASTTGTDADWVVKLIDVYPDSVPGDPALAGYQLMVNADILRGRYWRGFDHPTPIPAAQVTPFTVDLHQQLYRFRAGHRIMVEVQSSWFPLYDRNPQ